MKNGVSVVRAGLRSLNPIVLGSGELPTTATGTPHRPMIITCPHCRTQYQVTFETIGSAGRKVQCAHCRQAWQQDPLPAEPEPDPADMAAFDAIREDALDEVMLAEERAAAAELADRATATDLAQRAAAARPPSDSKTDSATMRTRQREFSRRRRNMEARLPLARLRRAVRTGAALTLAAVVFGLGFARESVVARFPDLAGVYEAVGLGVNVVGLEFTEVNTLHSLRDGKDMLMVSAQIVGIAKEPRVVPPVVVSLLDSAGTPIYEWSVTPAVRDLMAGERASFETQLLTPPAAASRVRLSFAGGSAPRAGAKGGNESTAANPPAAVAASGTPVTHMPVEPEHH